MEALVVVLMANLWASQDGREEKRKKCGGDEDHVEECRMQTVCMWMMYVDCVDFEISNLYSDSRINSQPGP